MTSNSDFDEAYFNLHGQSAEKRVLQHRLDYLRVSRFLGENSSTFTKVPPSLNIIDIGCADGAFSQLFLPFGKVYGVEISESQAKKAREILFQVEDRYPSEVQFDLVIIRGTLQHLPHSEIFFNFVETNLKSNGVLAILANPNSASLMFRRTGTLPALEVRKSFSSNFKVFNKNLLESCLNGIQFSEIEVTYDYLGTPYARPLSDIPLGILSLLTGHNFRRPFPGNMFNWIGRRF
jgi:SAM-dependent methyltransferase